MASNRKVIFSQALLMSISLLLVQCQDEKASFYKDPMPEYDVWRLPVFEPYQLITADCCRAWNFQSPNFSVGFSADSINYNNKYITYYGFPNTWGFLDIRRKKIIRLNDYQVFIDSVKVNGISRKLYFTETVYKCWRKTGQLPWAKEILAAQGCD